MNHIQNFFFFSFFVELNRRLAECAAVAAEATNMMNYPVQQQPKVCEHLMIKFSLSSLRLLIPANVSEAFN
jgi:hypothetical protein